MSNYKKKKKHLAIVLVHLETPKLPPRVFTRRSMGHNEVCFIVKMKLSSIKRRERMIIIIQALGVLEILNQSP